MAEATITSLPITKVRRSEAAQMRTKVSETVIDEYAAAIENNTIFPPVVAFGPDDEGIYDLADGFQRVAAFERAGKQKVQVDIRKGGIREAILYAVGANEQHGVRRTESDRRKAVLTLLSDKEWGKLSADKLCKWAHVRKSFVLDIKQELKEAKAAERGETVEPRKKKEPKSVPVPGGGNVDILPLPPKALDSTAATPESITVDRFKQSVPDGLKAAFAHAKTGAILAAQLTDMIGEIKVFGATAAATQLHVSSVLEAVRTAAEGISKNICDAVCPQCDGTKSVEVDGKKLACPSCAGRGWLTFAGVNALMKPMKKKLTDSAAA